MKKEQELEDRKEDGEMKSRWTGDGQEMDRTQRKHDNRWMKRLSLTEEYEDREMERRWGDEIQKFYEENFIRQWTNTAA